MGKLLKIMLALVLGSFVGFFGVFLSVFADGPLDERLITITVILVIYGVLGVVFGYLERTLLWKWGFIIGSPGILALLIYSIKESNNLFPTAVYLTLILTVTSLGSYLPRLLKTRN